MRQGNLLAYLYRNGKGVPQDFAKAYFWFDLATAAEQDASLLEQTTKYKATKHRDEAAFHLTPANLSREQERVRKWFEAHRRSHNDADCEGMTVKVTRIE